MFRKDWSYRFLVSATCLFSLVACEKEEPTVTNKPPTSGSNANAKVNSWIEDVMREVYYWEDDIPATLNKSLAPEDFFETILSTEDRFSFITPDYEGLINSLSGVSKSAGFEFQLTLESSQSNNVVAIVLYTLPGSPADLAGLKRGDVIKRINGTQMTTSNYRSLLSAMQETYTADFIRWNEATQSFAQEPQVTLATQVISENPNYLDSVYTINGQKIAYYIYNFFSPGVDNTSIYDQEMEGIISDFKAKGANHLILDLRYNGGGAVSSSTNLASLIGSGVDESEIYYSYQWNDLYQAYFQSQPGGDENLRGYFINRADNIGGQISGNTIYILTGSGTASASELIINGLKPYMNIVLIGETTVGKNVGSIPIQDTESEENKYGLLPIVFKIFNSQGDSDYSTGFEPNILADDFSFPMLPLGDVNEALLSTAINQITGSGARYGLGVRPFEGNRRLKSSLEQKPNFGRMIIQQQLPGLNQ